MPSTVHHRPLFGLISSHRNRFRRKHSAHSIQPHRSNPRLRLRSDFRRYPERLDRPPRTNDFRRLALCGLSFRDALGDQHRNLHRASHPDGGWRIGSRCACQRRGSRPVCRQADDENAVARISSAGALANSWTVNRRLAKRGRALARGVRHFRGLWFGRRDSGDCFSQRNPAHRRPQRVAVLRHGQAFRRSASRPHIHRPLDSLGGADRIAVRLPKYRAVPISRIGLWPQRR